MLWRLSSSGGSSAERAERRREVAKGLLEYRPAEVLELLALLAADTGAAADATARKAAERMLRLWPSAVDSASHKASVANAPRSPNRGTAASSETQLESGAAPPSGVDDSLSSSRVRL